MPANPVNASNAITVVLSPKFSVLKTNPTNNITSMHCRKTITNCVNICAIKSSVVVIPENIKKSLKKNSN